ncbi:hypothetical protein PHLCEN_2v3616 [Hermanssonia centrifuga]|uniref:Uncharacterized protein n=1 Tax=Hermanssonia centrifuga TaxID=98765 RepID=A0A2R6QEI4_9APHY|nr:hypothetical protein PHLCEN_2v3616 [Hermanssonia centrifuga]
MISGPDLWQIVLLLLNAQAYVGVNGHTPVLAQTPLSGQSWDILFSGYLVVRDGFKPGMGNNVIGALDILRMGV